LDEVFVVDAMLGRTARWLRILGLNVLYDPSWSDDRLLEVALRLNATVLTRDRELASRAASMGLSVLEVSGKSETERMRFLIKKLGLRPVIDPSRSRCPVCNGSLREVSKEDVSHLVPEGVLRRQERFWICVECGKVYWLGSHFRNMKKFLERCVNEAGT